MAMFAHEAAIAIKNAQLFKEVERLKNRLQAENFSMLREELELQHNFEEMVGDSPALKAVFRKAEQVAPIDSTVLILGETGTGKELIARAIHNLSPRKDRALVRVNCAAIPPNLVESELFGHEKGSFTGALSKRIGRFELADGGTILLDEVGELPIEAQAKLLRVLQEREFDRVGSHRPTQVNVRVIATTNRDLPQAVKAGTFRADLLYRLDVFPIEVPPLRARTSDIPLLVSLYARKFSKKFGKRLEDVSQRTMEQLTNYGWPGNVRELEHVIERAAILSQGPSLQIDESVLKTQTSQPTCDGTLEDVEKAYIIQVLRETDWVVEGDRGAAVRIDLHPNTLRSRMQKLGI
ncbi:MAG: sigma 54-interacting transcriptional regulator, partial [Nitrospira sp.]|nr:sigma 54-interacting transcriptional regulator [Nitrospira sp.]